MNDLCPACLSENPKDAIVCPICGYSLKTQGDIHHLDQQTLLVNPDSKNQYRIEKNIGEGGFGITYKGFDLQRLNFIAIKEYWPVRAARRNKSIVWPLSISIENQNEQLQKFIEEAQNIKLCNHFNIVKVYDYFRANNTAYLIMEYIEGITLYELVKQNGPLNNTKVRKYFLEIADSLNVIHAQKLLHRDIKPDNIMIDQQDRVVLIDFGNAREFIANKTFAMTTCLTPGYAPLEQYSKQAKRSPALDIYALCATFYYAITGIEPPAATDRIESDPLQIPSQVIPSIDPLLEQIILTGLKIKTTERFSTADDLLESLQGNWISPTLKTARHLVRENNLAKAIEVYQSCLEAPGTLIEQAIVQIWQGDLLTAQTAKRAIELDPNDGRGYGILGVIYCRQKKWQLAFENLKQADYLMGVQDWILVNLSWCLINLQQWEGAQKILQNSSLNFSLIDILKSYILLQKKQYKEAIKYAKNSLAKVEFSSDIKLLEWLYSSLLVELVNNREISNKEDLEETYNNFSRIDPNSHLIDRFKIWQLAKEQNWQKVIEHCQTIQVDDCSLLNIAGAQEKSGLLDEALLTYGIYLTKHPKNNYALYRMGVIYIYLKQWRNAKDYLERSIKEYPHQAKAHHNLGYVLNNIKTQEGELEYPQSLLEAYKKAIYYYNKAGETELSSSILDNFRKVKIDLNSV